MCAPRWSLESMFRLSEAVRDHCKNYCKFDQRRVKLLILWSHPPGSNRRPADYESAALPTELGWLKIQSLTGNEAVLEGLIVTLWERFIQDRVYLKGVSPATVRYYRWVERAFRPILDAPTKAGMLD